MHHQHACSRGVICTTATASSLELLGSLQLSISKVLKGSGKESSLYHSNLLQPLNLISQNLSLIKFLLDTLCTLKIAGTKQTRTNSLIGIMCCTFILSVNILNTVNASHEFLMPLGQIDAKYFTEQRQALRKVFNETVL